MTTNSPVTWRDLVAGLTPQSRAALACAHIPAPRDAIDTPSSWLLWDDNDVCQRGYTIWRADEDGITVEVLGVQFSDDRPIIRTIAYEDTARNEDMTAERARTLARLLVEASDILGDGGEPPWPVDSAIRRCCGVIGGHAPDCDVEPPFT